MKWVKFAWVERYKAKFGVLMRQSKYQWVHNLTYIFVLIVYKHITHSAHKTSFGPFGCHTAKRVHVLAEKRCRERHYNMVYGAIGLKPENSKGDIYRYIWGAFKFLISTLSSIIIRIFCIYGSLFLISFRKFSSSELLLLSSSSHSSFSHSMCKCYRSWCWRRRHRRYYNAIVCYSKISICRPFGVYVYIRAWIRMFNGILCMRGRHHN